MSKPVASGHEFDLHGIVGVRLIDARPGDVASVRRQLGPLEKALGRRPDISIRFVDSCADETTGQPLTYAGLGDGAFDHDSFYVLKGKGQVSARAQVPFDLAGQPLEIVCERRMPAVPHLITFINLAALAKGVLPLHASAFTLEGTGVLVTGWSKGGKTETLLGCMADGADFVGDEWIYLTPDGQMLGLPEPIRLWSWQLQQMRGLLAERPLAERARLRTWDSMALILERVTNRGLPGASLMRRALPAVRRQAYLQIPPFELFGADAMTLRGRLDVVILVASSESEQTVCAEVEAAEVARRMAASLAEERAMFMEHYRQFRFAFPDRRSDAVEKAEDLELALLHTVLEEVPARTVLHPYPCQINELGRAVFTAARQAMR